MTNALPPDGALPTLAIKHPSTQAPSSSRHRTARAIAERYPVQVADI